MIEKRALKLCLIAPVPPPYGGIANWYLLLKQYMEECMPEIKVSTINIAPKKSRVTGGKGLYERVVKSGLEMFSIRSRLKQEIKRERPDVIHMTTSGQLAIIRDVLLLKTAQRFGIPTVYHIRFGRIPEISERNTMEWKLLRKAVELSDKIITLDEATCRVVKKAFPLASIYKIPNPFDQRKLNGLELCTVPRKEIVFVGWVVKTKGIEELLDGWAAIRDKYPEYSLKILGPIDESYKAQLLSQHAVERVDLMGEVSNRTAIEEMNVAEILILPSYTEGFPNVVLEGMALGKPIVATKVGAIPEMLNDGCGVLIESHSSEQVAWGLEKMLADISLRETCGTNAKLRLAEQYSIETVFSQYLNIWSASKETKPV